MSILTGLLAGLIAGIFMISFSEIGCRMKLIKGNLIIIDGTFALQKLNRKTSPLLVYTTGIIVHLITSLIFGLVYILLERLLGFTARSIISIAIYTLLLWLAMLFVALPAAGQGVLGKKSGRTIWIEQLILHIIFGLFFFWVLIF